MNLVRRRGSHAEGCYATLFFVDDRAIKVFKRRGDSPPHHVEDVFYSEVEAYLHSAASCQICQYTQHFIGLKTVFRIEDESGHDISSECHPGFAYEMVRLSSKATMVGGLELEFALRIEKLYWDAGVKHMRDCLVFLDQAGELMNVIDFAM